MIANDLLPSAVEAIKRNVQLNELTIDTSKLSPTKGEHAEKGAADASVKDGRGAKVQINEGDAWFGICFLSPFQNL